MAQRDIVQMVLQLKDDASPSLKRVGNAANEAGQQAETAANKFRVSKKAVMGLAAAATGVVVGMAAMVKSLVDAQNLLTDTATRTGLTTETLAGLKLAAEGSGLQFEALSAGLTQFPKRMSDMARNTGEAKVAFEALGISVTNADGSLRSADDVMKESLQRLGGVESATDRAALATQLFGRSGTALLQALSGTELEEFVAEAEKFGINIGPGAAKAAGDLQREIARFSLVADRSKQMFLEAFGGKGGAAGAVRGFGAILFGIVATFKAVMQTGSRAFGIVTAKVTDLVQAVFGLAGALSEFLQGNFHQARQEAKKTVQAYDFASKQLREQTGEVFDGSIKKAILDAMKMFETPAAGTGVARAPAARTELAAVGEEAKASEAAKKALEDRQKAFEDAAKAFGSQLDAMQKALRGPQTESERMEDTLRELTESFELAKAKAMELGTTSSAEFLKMATEYKSTAEEMREAIEKQRAAEVAAAKEAAFDRAASGIRQVTSGITSPAAGIGALGQMGGAAGPIVAAIQGLGAIGEMGAEKIKESIKGFIDSVIVGLVEVLPDLIGEVPALLIEALPDIILGALRAIPRILKALILDLPAQIAKGSLMALYEIWQTVKAWLGEALDKLNPKRWAKDVGSGISKAAQATASFLGFQTGGFVNKDGFYALHAGERVMPSSGASTQAMFAGAENINTGQAVTINTNVMDPNAIDGLARMLQRELGGFGGGRGLGVFNTPAASAG